MLSVRQKAFLKQYPNKLLECLWKLEAERFVPDEPTTKPQPLIKDKPNYAPSKLKILHYASATRPNVYYLVRCHSNGKVEFCSCEGFKYRKTCWHRSDVELNGAKLSVKPVS